ncbi:hypothetical protein QZH41_008337 [Actinostola sp. cb2023]|nr:hypothetical protein QZH41_008337 [Actinostola sp. cb2023]
MISSSKGIISLWDLKTKRAHTNLDKHSEKGILGLDITKDSKLISHGRDGFINIWDLGQGGGVLQTKISAPVFGFCKFSILPKGKCS